MNEKSYWHTYIVRCKDDTLYTGISNDLEERIKKHNLGKGAAYTRGRRPVELICSERFATHKEAAQRECAIKKLTRQQKENLIAFHKTHGKHNS